MIRNAGLTKSPWQNNETATTLPLWLEKALSFKLLKRRSEGI